MERWKEPEKPGLKARSRSQGLSKGYGIEGLVEGVGAFVPSGLQAQENVQCQQQEVRP